MNEMLLRGSVGDMMHQRRAGGLLVMNSALKYPHVRDWWRLG